MRILIIRVSALGDAIHTLPALDILKKTFPLAHIDWLIQQKISGIIEHIPGLHKIYTLNNHYLKPAHLAETLQLLKVLRSHRYDLIIDFQGLGKTSILILGIAAPSIGFGWQSAREPMSCLAHTYTINPASTSSIIEKNIALAQAAINVLKKKGSFILGSRVEAQDDREESGCPNFVTPGCDPGLTQIKRLPTLISAPQAGSQALATIASWLKPQTNPRLILLAPNTTWPSKHWPLVRWQELVSTLTLPKHTIILLGQHFGTQGRELATFIEQHSLPVTIAPPWSLEEIFAVMPHTDTIIAPDTGLLHIADAMGVATVGLYGPTLVSRHGPLITPGNREHCFQVSCPHKYEKFHAKPVNPGDIEDCMLMLEANEVAKQILQTISERH